MNTFTSLSLTKYKNIHSTMLKFYFLSFFISGFIHVSNAQSPVAVNDSIVIIESSNPSAIYIDVQANDMDPNNNPLNTSLINYPSSGGIAIVLNGDSIQYIPPANFSGQDVMTYEVCTSSSLCDTATVFITVNPLVGIGVIDNNFDHELSLYPNPTIGDFSIDLRHNYKKTIVTVTDLVGRIVQTEEYMNRQLLNLKLEEPAGVYFLIIESENKKAIIRLVKI